MKILLVGCGNIGKALLKSWAQNTLWQHITVIQPSLSQHDNYTEYPHIHFLQHGSEISNLQQFDITALTIKPQSYQSIQKQWLYQHKSPLLLSFMAGISHEELLQTHKHAQIVRVMPNVAIASNNSVHLAFAPILTNNHQKALEALLSPSGHLLKLEKESLIDQLTPISGSGPAYLAILAEELTQSSIQAGLSEIKARTIVQQLFIGTAALMMHDSNFEVLAQSVCSKGGVTEAALNTMRPLLHDTIEKSLKAALARLQELSHENSR